LRLKTFILEKNWNKIKIFSTENIICRKYAAVFQKIITSCFLDTFLTHETAGRPIMKPLCIDQRLTTMV